jgi:ribosomal protein S18 acetylase RimI-like enzyme
MNDDFIFIERPPGTSDYHRLRQAVGWEDLDDPTATAGLANALYSVVVEHNGETIGCGRVVGDGAIYFYIQDIIVLPAFQGQGLGRRIMDHVMDYFRRSARRNAFIGLMAADGIAAFYEPYGFKERPGDRPGMSMLWEE